ncbi:MAG TPA: hypothetical protein VFV39_06680, partial [Limnobacter sp.]|nr:hypothetical protein [Limnobacter sp.]
MALVSPAYSQLVSPQSKIELRNHGETLGVSMDIEAGALGVVNLAQGAQATTLSVEFKGMSVAEVKRIADSLAQSPEVDSFEVLPGLDGRSVLAIRFKQFMRILDETVVAYGESRSRWEIVMEILPQGVDVTPLVTVSPMLGSLDFAATDNRLDIFFNGNAALQADVSLSADATQ